MNHFVDPVQSVFQRNVSKPSRFPGSSGFFFFVKRLRKAYNYDETLFTGGKKKMI